MPDTIKSMQEEFDALGAEIESIKKTTESFRSEREYLAAQAASLREQMIELTAQINAREQPALHEKKMRRGKLARVLQSVRDIRRK